MTTDSGSELAERLAGLGRLNDIDDAVGVTAADCNYEDFEEFTNNVDLEFFERDHVEILKELKKLAENVLISGEKCDVRNVLEESTVTTLKFNLFIWYFLENGRKSDSSEESVRNAVFAASTYLSMCALKGANSQLYQVGLYNQCLKVARNCCHTIRIGEIVASKKAAGARKKKGAKTNETVREREDEEDAENPVMGPPRIAVDSAERFLHHLITGLFGFLVGNTFSIDEQTILTTMEMIEDLGRLDLDSRTTQRTRRANSVHEFRSLERFTDRYTSFVHALIESKYQTRRNMAYGRLIRPRLALIPYPDDGNKTAKISTERKRAGELTVNLILSRIERKPDAKELKLIETVLVMVYTQCPDLAEFRTNIAQFIHKILEALPYQYAYDFVQLMNIMFKGRSSGVKSLSTELTNVLISSFDFAAPDPGPVPDVAMEGGEEEKEDEGEPEEEPEAEEEGPAADSEDDDSEDESNKTRRQREKQRKEEEKRKKKEKKAAQVKDLDRVDALSILYNIVYLACLDKSAAMRLHGSHSLAKILASPTHRNAFQEFCQNNNANMDDKLGEVGDDALNESSPDSSNHEARTKKSTDLLLGEQQIIEKFNKLKMMNQGEVRVEKDIIYMLVRRLASDEKVPVKKSSSVLLKLNLSFCDEEIKFETLLGLIQKQCRDKNVAVRKNSGEALTDLMLTDNILFKDILGSKWLHSLISMLNDTDNDVTEHARKLIMKVLTPLLEEPSDLTWTLLDTIESVTNHRHYIMSALKGAVREKLVKKSVIDKMKAHILSRSEKQNGAWMVFSQLCVQFEQNVDFAIEEFNKVDLSKPLNTLQYMVHIIENNIKHIHDHVKDEFIDSLSRTLNDYCLHASHARTIYHCLGKLMNGIGDRSSNQKQLEEFGEQLIVKCFDTIVQSFDMFKDKEEWKRNAELQERLLCTALNVANEVFTYSPQLIQRHERLAKTLSLIVNSYDANSTDATNINPEMPSAHHTRPHTQLSQYPQSQEGQGGGGIMAHEGLLFSDNVRAVSVVTLVNMIVAHDRLLKLMPPLVKQLQRNPSHQIRSNIVVALGDVCNSFKTDRYAPMLAASLCDPSVLVRRHAINQIARLICNGIFRFNGEIMIRMMLGTLDANEDVRNDAKLYISEVLQAEDPNFFKNNFVQYMLALTQARRLVGVGHDEEETGQIDVAIGGGISLARPSRIAIYTFMIESLDDRSKFEVKRSISERIFIPIVNGEYDFKDVNTQCLLDDALLIMASNEMQIKMEVGKDPNENALDEPPPEAVEAATGFMQKVYLENYLKVIVPAMLALREFLHVQRSSLQRKCVVAIKMICHEHRNDIDEILQDNVQLKEEILFEMQRVKKRTEEAHKILDEYLKRVVEFRKQQKRLSKSPRPPGDVPEAPEDVEMRSPAKSDAEPAAEIDEMADESMRTPVKNPVIDALRTPGTALRSSTEKNQGTPGSRALSPKTLRKIRRSVGALLNNAPDERLNAPNLEDTNVLEGELSTSRRAKKTTEKDKTIVEEESMEEGEEASGGVQQEALKEKTVTNPGVEEPDKESNNSEIRRSKRKTPTYNDDESIDANGKVWKKPKILCKSPEKNADISSANVTLRRSRRVSRQEAEPVPEKPKTRKRRAIGEDDDQEDPSGAPSTSENVENTPRGQTPLSFDESKIMGRQCSTPINGRDSDAHDMTFGLNDVSAIIEKESTKNRKSYLHHLKEIFEDDEEEGAS